MNHMLTHAQASTVGIPYGRNKFCIYIYFVTLHQIHVLHTTMPATRRNAVSARSSRVESDDESTVISRVVRSSIRNDRKPSRSRRFVKETDPALSTRPSTDNAGVVRQHPLAHFDDPDPMNDPDDTMPDPDADNDNASDFSDDDPLPSFGPQLSLNDEPINRDVVDFSQMDFTETNVRLTFSLHDSMLVSSTRCSSTS